MLRLLLMLLVVPACQCLEPVAEETDDAGADAGRDAGSGPNDAGRNDAGSDAGLPTNDGGVECRVASDCGGTPWSSAWCQFGAPPGFSCVAERCVAECVGDAGQTCISDTPPSDCLTCSAGPICATEGCPTDAFVARVSTVECRPGFAPTLMPGDELSFVPVRGASCMLSVSAPARGLGLAIRDTRSTRHAWFLRELGGWCVGDALPTGAIRSVVACPACTFGVEGF